VVQRKLQTVVALSSTKAKYMAAVESGKEVLPFPTSWSFLSMPLGGLIPDHLMVPRFHKVLLSGWVRCPHK
jgi:hypothetical protein